jgi:hypothetical protein
LETNKIVFYPVDYISVSVDSTIEEVWTDIP